MNIMTIYIIIITIIIITIIIIKIIIIMIIIIIKRQNLKTGPNPSGRAGSGTGPAMDICPEKKILCNF